MFNKVNVPVLGIVENMSYFVCGHCGERENIFDSGGGSRTAKELGVPFLGEIPINTRIRIGGDQGTPIVVMDETSKHAETIRQIARKLAAQISILHASAPPSQKVEILIGGSN
jgi:ATP-binding protein involved in chromosome partitioning